MARFAALNEEDPPAEMIHNRLSMSRVPPFRGIIILASCHDDPESPEETGLLHLGHPGFFQSRDVDVAVESGLWNGEAQLVSQVLCERMNEVVGPDRKSVV